MADPENVPIGGITIGTGQVRLRVMRFTVQRGKREGGQVGHGVVIAEDTKGSFLVLHILYVFNLVLRR